MAFTKFLVLLALSAVSYAADEEFLLTPGIPGGINTADQNSETFTKALEVAMAEINKVPSLGSNKLTLKEVINARMQVVAGTLHHLTLHVVPTACEKTAAATEKCEAVAGHAGYRCALKVVTVPWEKKIEVIDKIDCKPM